MIIFIYGQDTYRSKQKLDFYREGFLKKYGDFNVSVYDNGADFSKIKNDIMSLPFMAEKRLIILRDFLKSKKESLDDLIRMLDQIPEEVVLLFYEEGEPDKRTALYKRLNKEKQVEIFKNLEGAELSSWIKKDIAKQRGEIESPAVQKLISFVGSDLWQLSSEIKKLLDYDKKITDGNVKKLINEKPETNIFEMTDALSRKNKKESLKRMYKIFEAGENEIYVLTMIIRQYRILLMTKELVQKNLRQDEIIKILKMHPFVVKKAVEQVRGYEMEDLKNIYEDLKEADVQMKTGQRDPRLALDLLVEKICR